MAFFYWIHCIRISNNIEGRRKVFSLVNMGRLINAFQTKIVFLTLVFLTSICSQILYETDDQQNTILNRRSKDVSAKSTLDETKAFLKKKTSSLQICIDNEDAYYDSLIFNSQRQTPSGKIYCFVFSFLFIMDDGVH